MGWTLVLLHMLIHPQTRYCKNCKKGAQCCNAHVYTLSFYLLNKI